MPTTRREMLTVLVLLTVALAAMAGVGWRTPAPPPGAAPPTTPTPLDLNRATWQEFELLPGFGETLAHAVIEHRIRHGPFRSAAELRQVPGMTDRIFGMALPEVTVREGR
ncbi:MAG: helix-hairpin-helix domain-containing protein [Planctomycetes bacterium]|nr:helix-hairpin-helix domain-containing protein [Planctomycetota bacterium]